MCFDERNTDNRVRPRAASLTLRRTVAVRRAERSLNLDIASSISSCLPYGRCTRSRISRPCLYRVRVDGNRGSPPRRGQPSAYLYRSPRFRSASELQSQSLLGLENSRREKNQAATAVSCLAPRHGNRHL